MVTCNKLVEVPENEGGRIIIITRNRKLIFINFKEDDQMLTNDEVNPKYNF
jgi:hypothetical protein